MDKLNFEVLVKQQDKAFKASKDAIERLKGGELSIGMDVVFNPSKYKDQLTQILEPVFEAIEASNMLVSELAKKELERNGGNH